MTDLDRRVLLGIAGVAGIAAVSRGAQAGSLNPPAGPVAPTMKPLSDVEPRIAVQSLAGDSGSQYIISQPGSYYLTGNINGASNMVGISINASNVVLDLNGFALLGVAGSQHGIYANGNSIAIRNGTISGWGGSGVNYPQTSTLGRVEYVNVDHCTGGGISVAQRGTVTYCTASACGTIGISGLNECRIVQCSATATTGTGNGIGVDYSSVIQDCSAAENGGSGLVANGSAILIFGCSATFNSGDGVLLNGGALNHVVDTIASRNTLNGFHATADNNRIDRCSAIQNTQAGIKVDLLNGANVIVRCTATNNGVDYSIAAGNRPAQVASWGSVAGGFGATDAVANVR